MPKEILPITELDTVGVVLDTPPVSLPPNAFSDVRNVRFKDGAVSKMEGEINIFPELFNSTDVSGNTLSYDDSTLKYIAWWPNPNIITDSTGYYLVIKEEDRIRQVLRDNTTNEFQSINYYVVGSAPAAPSGSVAINTQVQRDIAYLISPGTSTLVEKGTFSPDREANWQHTFFQGGFSIIINNGLNAPHYILDTDGNTNINNVPNFQALPGWDSYNVFDDIVVEDVFNAALNERVFDTQRASDTFTNYNLRVVVQTITETTSAVYDTLSSVLMGQTAITGLTLSIEDGQIVLTFTEAALPDAAMVTIRFESKMEVVTRCGVIRTFGDFLVAGNLTEYVRNEEDPEDTSQGIIRNLSGIVRSSDVAAPGSVPTNWNPFATGVSTADEFILTATGVVQDMVELQGNFYIYSNTSISTMRQTGNAQIPLSVSTITESYGAQTTEAVLEYDGKHFVVGSQDIYLFGGHPGTIQSVADQRVRNYFFSRLNPIHNERMFCLRYAQRDEIWVCFPTLDSIRGECDLALIWNYRQNIWTIRSLESVVAGNIGPIPGGGLPSSNIDVNGTSGNNAPLSTGEAAQLYVNIPAHFINGASPDGLVSIYTVGVENTFPEENIEGRAAIDFTIQSDFDAGPNYGVINGSTGDGVHNGIPALGLTATLTPTAGVATVIEVDLPRFLSVDAPFDPTRVYFAGMTGSYDGQRVTRVIGSDTVVYRVLSGGDSEAPSSFYDPDEDAPFYTSSANLVYQDTFDILGVNPEDLVVGATYGTTPGDGGTGNTLAANQARWERLTESPRTLTDVVNTMKSTFEANSEFNTHFEILELGTPEDEQFIIRPRALSGASYTNPETGATEIFPSYEAFSVALAFPPIPLSTTNMRNGGNINGIQQAEFESADPDDEAVPVLEFTTGTFDFIHDADNIENNRYERSTVIERVFVALAGDFRASNANRLTDVARLIRDAFDNSSTNRHWDASFSGDVVTLTSLQPDKHYLDLSISNNRTGFTIETEDFTIQEVQEGVMPHTADNPAIAPVYRITPPNYDASLGLAEEERERPPILVYGRTDTGSSAISTRDIAENLFDTAFMTYLNWDYRGTDPFATRFGGQDIDMMAIEDLTNPAVRLRPASRYILGQWNVEVVNRGNTGTPNPDLGQTIPRTIGGTSFTGLPTQITTTQTFIGGASGYYDLRATPTYLGVLVNNATIPEGFEFYVIDAGEEFLRLGAEAAATRWQDGIRDGMPRLSVDDRGSDGQFFIQPSNYSDLANFILELRVNDTVDSANWIYRTYTEGVVPSGSFAGQTVSVNSASIVPFVNDAEAQHPFDYVDLSGDAEGKLGNSLRDGGPLKVHQFVLSGTPLSGSSYAASRADMSIDTGGSSTVFDTFRPWPTAEINPNLEYPILATSPLRQDTGGVFRRLNKIVGADVGFSRPNYSFTPRESVEDTLTSRLTITEGTDDAPVDYESYVERTQMAISPEFDTEEVVSVALWADGSTPEYLRGPTLRNQLSINMEATNYPGDLIPLTDQMNNRFKISDDYKMDMRVHGRFVNYRITDNNTITEADAAVVDGRKFDHRSQWRLSGIQADIMKGGTR